MTQLPFSFYHRWCSVVERVKPILNNTESVLKTASTPTQEVVPPAIRPTPERVASIFNEILHHAKTADLDDEDCEDCDDCVSEYCAEDDADIGEKKMEMEEYWGWSGPSESDAEAARALSNARYANADRDLKKGKKAPPTRTATVRVEERVAPVKMREYVPSVSRSVTAPHNPPRVAPVEMNFSPSPPPPPRPVAMQAQAALPIDPMINTLAAECCVIDSDLAQCKPGSVEIVRLRTVLSRIVPITEATMSSFGDDILRNMTRIIEQNTATMKAYGMMAISDKVAEILTDVTKPRGFLGKFVRPSLSKHRATVTGFKDYINRISAEITTRLPEVDQLHADIKNRNIILNAVSNVGKVGDNNPIEKALQHRMELFLRAHQQTLLVQTQMVQTIDSIASVRSSIDNLLFIVIPSMDITG